MKKNWFTAGLLSCLCLSTFAQESTNKNAEKDSKKGEAIVTIFTNFHSGFGENNDDRGFDLERSYLGYQYNLNGGLQVKAVMDIGRSSDVGDYQRIAYIKNAMISWKYKDLTLNGGLIGTNQFGLQEKFWGKRYVMKSFQDEYKMGSSADLGLSAAYKFAPWISGDIILVNGEGYKKIQINDGLQYGAGVTVTPVNGLTLRVYGSYNEAADKEKSGMANMAAFVGYAQEKFSVGAEYNYQSNASFTKECNQNGVSAYTTVQLCPRLGIYGRWDYLSSKDDWNKSNDGMAGMVGAEVKLGKYIKLAPNFRIWSPKDDSKKNSYYAYLNCSFSL